MRLTRSMIANEHGAARQRPKCVTSGAPHLIGSIVDPVRPRLALDRCPGGRGGQHQVVGDQHPVDAGRRHPHPVQVGAAVRKLAMGAVDLAPLLGQLEDRLDLFVQQAMDRAAAAWMIRQRASGPPGLPAVDPTLGHLQHPAGVPQAQPLGDGLVDQRQQGGLGGGCHARGDTADQPQRDFPRSSTSSIACSLTASASLAISARAAASSASSRAWRTPGLDAASASSAPCLAT